MAHSQTLENNLDSWYWKITPIEGTTIGDDGQEYTWFTKRSNFYPSKGACKQGIAQRLQEHPLDDNQTIECHDFAPINPDAPNANWGFRTEPLNGGWIDEDGEIWIWHGKIGKKSFPSRHDCIFAAKEMLIFLGGEAWNQEPKCRSPFVDYTQIQIQSIDADELGLEPQDLEAE